MFREKVLPKWSVLSAHRTLLQYFKKYSWSVLICQLWHIVSTVVISFSVNNSPVRSLLLLLCLGRWKFSIMIQILTTKTSYFTQLFQSKDTSLIQVSNNFNTLQRCCYVELS